MRGIFNFLNRNITLITWCAVALCCVIQLTLVACFYNSPQGSDPGAYIMLAQRCVSTGDWYPSADDLYSSYLFAPGWVNFLILVIRVFGTYKAAIIINLLMSWCVTWMIYVLGKRFFNDTVGKISVILWSLLYSNWFAAVALNTEVVFLFFALGAFTLIACYRDNTLIYILAGILFVTANWIRPLVAVFVVAALIYMLCNHVKWYNYLGMAVGLVITAYGIGQISMRNVGHFDFQSTTSGVNLIMSANDKAYGGVATHLFRDTTSTCYVENINEYKYYQRDSLYRAKAIEWIKEHPGKYSWLAIKKVGGLFVEDSWADRPLLGGDGFIGKNATGQMDKSAFVKRVAHMGLSSVVYYIVLILALVGLWQERKSYLPDFKTKGVLLLLLIMGVGANLPFSISPRYHYPVMFILVMFASIPIYKKLLGGMGSKSEAQPATKVK